MKWRKRWDVDNITNWKTPEALANYTPHGLSGFDKEGSPGMKKKNKNTLLTF